MKTSLLDVKVNTDEIMKTVFAQMSNDLAYLGFDPPCIWERGYSLNLNKWSDPYVFKAKYQLNTLFKRYVTEDEKKNNILNRDRAFAAFIATQERLCSHIQKKHSTFVVLQRARQLIRQWLGPYVKEEHEYFSRFGKRAAVGLPYRESYLDNRVTTLTGSLDHVEWFESEIIPKDDLLRRCCTKPSVVIDHLTLSDVPKAWDKRRTILKNSVLGGFYSAGLGDYMVHLLKTRPIIRKGNKFTGLNLNRIAEKHRIWIKKYSRCLDHVTADLSAASDSFTWSLMCKLFPRDWLRAMNLGRVPMVKIGGRVYNTVSFMTMGVGFTFPAQTLAFRAILQAIKDLSKSKGRISSFGDDLIYPTVMHPMVVSVLQDAGFILNKEKTFVEQPFRESCGADFYDGVDVRPFQPEGQNEVLSGLRLIAYIYKTYNGIQLRWSKEELPRTFGYLKHLLVQLTKGRIHQVPFDYPDYSGIQTSTLIKDKHFLKPITTNWITHFECLSFKFRLRQVPIQLPYLWDTLRSKTTGQKDWAEVFDPLTGLQDTTTLKWRKMKIKRSSHNGPPRWVVRLIPHVSLKGSEPGLSLIHI